MLSSQVYLNYSPVADISTIALGIGFFILLWSSVSIRQRSFTVFRIAMITLLLAAICNISFYKLLQSFTEREVGLIYLLRVLNRSFLLETFFLYDIYLGEVMRFSDNYKRALHLSMGGGFLICTALEFASPLLRLGFYIDENLAIHENLAKDPFRYAYLGYALITLAILIRNRQKFINKIWICICQTSILSLFMVVVESFFRHNSFLCLSFAFPIFAVLFLFHNNPYDSHTGTLDYASFEAIVKECIGKNFLIINLYVEDLTSDYNRIEEGDFLHFNEQFFKRPLTFRIDNDHIALVWEKKEHNKQDSESIVRKILNEFELLYEKYHQDYKLVVIHSDDRLTTAREYVELHHMLERMIAFNSVYQSTPDDIDIFLEEKYIEAQLQDIAKKGDLSDERVRVYCQPIYNVLTGDFKTAEALMRLYLPEKGIVFPDRFIPIAEAHDYIHTLSKIILNKTCQAISSLEEKGYILERVSVNFSMVELKDPNFAQDVADIVRASKIPFSKIALELTESQNEPDFAMVQKVMQQLQKLGMKFYLDDFGTGYSSFERIMSLPIDIIKIDRSLTQMACTNDDSAFMVENFTEIFRNVNLQVLFEGVETKEDEKRCIRMGARFLQGYLYSRPIPIWQLSDFLQQV